MSDVVELIARQRVVPVLRSADVADAVATARACARAGMSVIELTCTTPGVEDALRALSRDEGVVLGLGTVTDTKRVARAVAAGARFVVSFGAPVGLVAAARDAGVPAIPGGLTPTEVAACLGEGAAAVKLFPARAVSPTYLRDLRAVMPDVRVLVTGGVAATRESIRPWLEAGALAVGLGSDIGTVAAHGADEVERRVRAALAAVS